MNKVILSGKLVTEPKFSMICGNGLAVLSAIFAQERDEARTKKLIIPIVFFGKYAVEAEKHLRCGMQFLIADGSMEGNEYFDENNGRRYQNYVVVHKFQYQSENGTMLEVPAKNIPAIPPHLYENIMPFNEKDMENIILCMEGYEHGNDN